MGASFPKETYLKRLGLSAAPAVSPAGLAELHLAQTLRIPFETIDPYLNLGVNLEPAALTEKLVNQDRGGYCFELNGLFLAALREFGFRARPLLARVLIGNAGPGPFTHQISLVEFGDERWIADVGFGGPGLRAPIPLREGPTEEIGRSVRLRPDAHLGWVFEQNQGAGWEPVYAFELREVLPIDLTMGNHFTSTWPKAIFRKRLMVARLTPAGRVTLDDLKFRRYGKAGLEEDRELIGPVDLRKTLGAEFGIALQRDALYHLHQLLAGFGNEAAPEPAALDINPQPAPLPL